MLSIIPVVHVGGSKEYAKYPGQISPTSKDFAVEDTMGYLINIVSNRDNFDRSKDTGGRKIFCDSGGLQLGTVGYQKDTPTPRQVMEYANQNADVCFALDDLSPFRRYGDQRLELGTLAGRIAETGLGPLFEKSARNTAENINQMMKVRNSKTKLYCIVQGFSLEQIDFFYRIVTKEHDLDGFGMKAIAPRSTIEAMAWIWDNVTKPVHILGNGRIGKTFPLVYFSTKFKPEMTADSTSWYSGAMYRRMYKGLGDLSYQTPDVNGVPTPTGPPRLACSCRVCHWGNEMLDAGTLKQTDYLFAHILSVHNWSVMIDDHLYATALAQKPELFREYAERFERYGEDMGGIMSDPISATHMVDAIDGIHDGNGKQVVEKYCKRVMSAEAFF